jgi:phenylalanine-4-hydroxylase
MFEEAQLYSPVTEDERGVVVHLAEDHPGANDPDYLARRSEIAEAALRWEPGTPAPTIEYTEEEQNVWRTVCRELAPKHERYACRAYRDGVAALGLPRDRIPQLEEVSALLEPVTGFRYLPAAGLVPLAEFYGSLADRVFHSTQYIRHPAAPLYTPEPDLIHEVIGHGNLLASQEFAELNLLAGQAARRCETEPGLKFLADVFWFTIEFGVLYEDRELKAYGAGILSSYGEIEEFRQMEIRPIDYLEMGTLEYDITHYQPVLYAADSMAHLTESLGSFFAGFDDDTPDRLKRDEGAHLAAGPLD